MAFSQQPWCIFGLLVLLLCPTDVVGQVEDYNRCYRGSANDNGEGTGVRHPSGKLIMTVMVKKDIYHDIKLQSTRRDRTSLYRDIRMTHLSYASSDTAVSGDDPTGGKRTFDYSVVWSLSTRAGPNLIFLTDAYEEYGWDIMGRPLPPHGPQIIKFVFEENKEKDEVYIRYGDVMLILHSTVCPK